MNVCSVLLVLFGCVGIIVVLGISVIHIHIVRRRGVYCSNGLFQEISLCNFQIPVHTSSVFILGLAHTLSFITSCAFLTNPNCYRHGDTALNFLSLLPDETVPPIWLLVQPSLRRGMFFHQSKKQLLWPEGLFLITENGSTAIADILDKYSSKDLGKQQLPLLAACNIGY
jgi:hypothetical protein